MISLNQSRFTPVRRALLIGAPGQGTNRLRGVKHDLSNVKRFLMSAQGGAWYDDEIRVLDDPDKEEVYMSLEFAEADYAITYWSGHGFESTAGRRFLSVSNGEYFEDLLFLNNSPRQLVLLDSCRNKIDLPIHGTPGFLGEDYYGDPIDLVRARKAYDQWIANSLPGKLILHSTNSGTSSYDTEVGGVFTNALLYAGRNVEHYHSSAKMDILSSASIVLSQLQRFNKKQLPTRTYEEGNTKLPFAIAPNKLKVVHRKSLQESNRSSSGFLVGLGVLALAAWAFSED